MCPRTGSLVTLAFRAASVKNHPGLLGVLKTDDDDSDDKSGVQRRLQAEK